MVNLTKGLHHFHLRKRMSQKNKVHSSSEKFKQFYDKLIYVVVILAPLANIPQLLRVWIDKDVSGVSSLSWFAFSIISLCWLVYGVVHKDRHILIMNAALMLIQALVALGVIVYH